MVPTRIRGIHFGAGPGSPRDRMDSYTAPLSSVAGLSVEAPIRHRLSEFVPLQPNRMLCWAEGSQLAGFRQKCAELDAVWTVDGVLAIGEIKLTTDELMKSGHGLKQLNRAAGILTEDTRYLRVLRRLIYVADEPLEVKGSIPAVDPCDPEPDLGVIWITPAEVEHSARQLGVRLPAGWDDPDARASLVEIPGRPDWQIYSASYSRPADAAETAMAAAFRRAAVAA